MIIGRIGTEFLHFFCFEKYIYIYIYKDLLMNFEGSFITSGRKLGHRSGRFRMNIQRWREREGEMGEREREREGESDQRSEWDCSKLRQT